MNHCCSAENSAASRTLDKLRTAFGDPLMLPQARGLSPTDGLFRLLPELRAAIEQAERLFTPFDFDPMKLRGTFRLITRGLVVPEILGDVIPRLAKQAPGIVLEHKQRTGAVWEEIEEGRVDLVLVTNRSVPASFHSVPLFDIEIGLLMRLGHPLAEKYLAGGITMEDIGRFGRVAMDVSDDYRHASWDRQLFGTDRFADQGARALQRLKWRQPWRHLIS